MRLFSKKLLLQVSGELNPWRFTKYSADEWNDVIFAQNKYVAISANGRIATSENGFEWTTVYRNTGYYFSGITYSNSLGLFVVVGSTSSDSASIIIYSSDASSWQVANTNSTCHYWVSVDSHIDSNYLVAVGENGYYSTSTNGTTWTTPKYISSTSTYKQTLRCVKANGGTMVTVGTNTVVSSINQGDSAWKTPYIAVPVYTETDEQGNTVYYEYDTGNQIDGPPSFNGLITPGSVGETEFLFTISTDGYLYYTNLYRNMPTSDFTPMFSTSGRLLLESNKKLCSIARKFITTSTYYVYVGNESGKIYKIKKTSSSIALESSENVIPLDAGDTRPNSINGLAFNGNNNMVAVSANGYLAFKEIV